MTRLQRKERKCVLSVRACVRAHIYKLRKHLRRSGAFLGGIKEENRMYLDEKKICPVIKQLLSHSRTHYKFARVQPTGFFLLLLFDSMATCKECWDWGFFLPPPLLHPVRLMCPACFRQKTALFSFCLRRFSWFDFYGTRPALFCVAVMLRSLRCGQRVTAGLKSEYKWLV